MDSVDKRIRDRAYFLWEQEGRPHGRDREHWEEARRLLGLEEAVSPAPSFPAQAAQNATVTPAEVPDTVRERSSAPAPRAVRVGGAKRAAPAAKTQATPKGRRSPVKAPSPAP